MIGGVDPVKPGEAPHWHVVFSVADRDASAATVERLGGTVDATRETAGARLADVRDPEGNAFTISQFAPRAWRPS